LSVEFPVSLPPPLDIAGSLTLFRRSGDDMIDRWDGRRLIRAVEVDGAWVPFAASISHQSTGFDVIVEDARRVDAIREVVSRTFVGAPSAYGALLAADPAIATLDAKFPGIRQIRQLDLFTALVRCISAQQVNLRWAVTTRRRLAEAFGQRHAVDGHFVYSLSPERIATVDPLQIRALQFTTGKSVSIVATARALLERGLDLHTLRTLDDDEVITELVTIRGIGRWSAEWVLARSLGRPRVVAGDLGVRKAVGLAYLDNPAPTEAEVRAATAHWGESAGTAQALLLHALGEGALTGHPAPPVSRAGSRR
jgi:DNA-3-methyladenine glycosylase II